MGILDAADAVTASIANILFGMVKTTGQATVSTFYDALTFNLAETLPDSVINSIQSGLVDGIFTPLFPLAFCAVAFNLISYLSKRDYSGLTAELIKTVVILVTAGLITTHSSTALKTISAITSKISTAVLVEMNGGAETEDFAAESAGLLWVSLVHTPWQSLEFYNNDPNSTAYDSGLVENILQNPIDDDRRKTLIEDNLDTGYFSKKINWARVSTLFAYMIPFFLKCLLFICAAAVTIPLQALTILLAFFAPPVLLLSLVPGFGGYNLIGRWAKTVLTVQLMALFTMMLLGFIFIISNTINSSLADRGWLLATLIEIVCFITLFLLRNQIFGLFGIAAATISGAKDRYRGYNKFDNISRGIGTAARETREKMRSVAETVATTIGENPALHFGYYSKDGAPSEVKRPSTTDKTKAELAAEAAEIKAEESKPIINGLGAEDGQRQRPYLYPPKPSTEASESSASILFKSVASGQTLNTQRQPEQQSNTIVRPDFSFKPKVTASKPPVSTVSETYTAAESSVPAMTNRRSIVNDSHGVPYVVAAAAEKEQPTSTVERPASSVNRTTANEATERSTSTNTQAEAETASTSAPLPVAQGETATQTINRIVQADVRRELDVPSNNVKRPVYASETSENANSTNTLDAVGQAQKQPVNVEKRPQQTATNVNGNGTRIETQTKPESTSVELNKVVQGNVIRELEVPENTVMRPESSVISDQSTIINGIGQMPIQTAYAPPETQQQSVKQQNNQPQAECSPQQHEKATTATVSQNRLENTTATLNKAVQGDALKSLEVSGGTIARPESSSIRSTSANATQKSKGGETANSTGTRIEAQSRQKSTLEKLNKVVQGNVLKELEVPENAFKRPKSSAVPTQDNITNDINQTPTQTAYTPPEAQQQSAKQQTYQSQAEQPPQQHEQAATATISHNKLENTTATLNKGVQGDALRSLKVYGGTVARPKSSSVSSPSAGTSQKNKGSETANSTSTQHDSHAPIARSSTAAAINLEHTNTLAGGDPGTTKESITRPETAAMNTTTPSTQSTNHINTTETIVTRTDNSNSSTATTTSQTPTITTNRQEVIKEAQKQPKSKTEPSKERMSKSLERTGNASANIEMNAVYIDNSSEEVKKKSLSEKSRSEKRQPPRQRKSQTDMPPATKEIQSTKHVARLPETQPPIQIGDDNAKEVKRPSTTNKRTATKKKSTRQ